MSRIILDGYGTQATNAIHQAVATYLVERAVVWALAIEDTTVNEDGELNRTVIISAPVDVMDEFLWDIAHGWIGGLRVQCETDAEYRRLRRDHDGRHYIEDPTGITTVDRQRIAREARIDANTDYFENAILMPTGRSE